MVKDFILGKHPVLIFLKEELKMNLSEFCLTTGIPQSTISTWFKREWGIEKYPIYFFVGIAALGDFTIDEVYNKLIRLESEYLVNQVGNKTFLAEEGIQLTEKVAREAVSVKADVAGSEIELRFLDFVRRLKKASEKSKKDEFLKVMIELYVRMGRTLPGWVTGILSDEDTFVEVSVVFVEVLSRK